MILENKKFYIFLIFILSFFYFTNKVKATNYIDIDNTEPYFNSVLTLYDHDYITQGFIPNGYNLSNLTNYIYGAYEPGTYIIRICKGDIDSVNSFYDCSNSELIASTSLKYGVNWNMDYDNLLLTPTQKYYYSVQYIDDPNFPGIPGHIQTIAYNDNYQVGHSYTNGILNGYALRFKTFYSDVITPNIELKTPVNGGTYKDFAFWQFNMSLPATTSNITLEIHYGNTDDGYTYNDYENVSNFNGIANMTYSINKNESLKNLPSAKIYYYADLIAEDENNNVYFLDTDIGYFIIDEVNGLDTFPVQELGYFASSTYDHICDDVATSTGLFFDDFRFGIECGFKKIIYWAISPSASSLNSIRSSYDTFKLQFPFNAYFGLTDTINKSISTSTATTGTLKMPMVNKTGDYYMLDVMSSSTLPNLIGGSNANLFRNSISWLMWSATAFMVFITFKKV